MNFEIKNFFWFVIVKNIRRTQVILVCIFLNAWNKVINFQKRPKWRFWWLTLINTAHFGTLITPGVGPIMLHTLLCLLVAHSWAPEWLVGSQLFSLLNCWGCHKKRATLYVILTHLQWSDPKFFFARSWLILSERRMSKKLGSYHSKNWFLGLRIPNLDWKSAQEAFF